ncbi:hypothetical protein F4821DRAFT_231948 [Hypoxylon rubiginosum]|uniref:Uncharacterized protein n=1 Tax=Hypoxylon rubiginosum TaxID=110542 RepID=A0ACC0D8W7_9PEZI|nr:hypothetical protein F4821DRAFT_231948 [Hypoxylon rubiginosum]
MLKKDDGFLDALFPDGGWITRDWLIDAYPDVRSELDPKYLARGDQMLREWTREKQREERTGREADLAAYLGED